MSVEIPVAFVHKWRDDVIHLSQQEGSRLRPLVRSQTGIKGKSDNWERLGATAMQKITSRHAKTPLISTPHSRRRCTLGDYNVADVIDSQDAQKVMAKLEGEYMQAMANAAGRQYDDLIISAATGNAVSVGSDDTETNVALPSAQKIAHGSAGLTLAKIIEAKRILDASDVDERIPRCLAVSAKQMEDMLGINQITSMDYNNQKTLVNGSVDTFLGFKVIRTERLGTDSNGDRQVLAWAMDGIGLSIGAEADMVTRISERADLNYATQCYLELCAGATRIEDEKVVEIACQES